MANVFWQLLDYHFYDGSDLPENASDAEFDAHVRNVYPLIAHLDVYDNWKGCNIEICNHAQTAEQREVTDFLMTQVFMPGQPGLRESCNRLRAYWIANRPG